MTDDEDPHSRTPSPPAAGPTPTPPPPPVLTLALPIQTPNSAGANNPNSSDTWSEGATSALIDAWGERYLRLGRGSLKHHHWQEVAEAVFASASAPRTDAQCKNRIDTLKKKYKSEKSKISSGQLSRSAWPFFHRLDILIGPTLLKSQPPPAFPPQFPQRSRTQTVAKKRSRSRSRSPGPDDDGEEVICGWAGMARAVARFGEAYERVERGKVKQAVEMERNRMGFVKQLELQRMEFFVKTQVELARVRPRLKKRHRRKDRRRSREENGNSNANANANANGDHHHHHHHRHHHDAGNNDSES